MVVRAIFALVQTNKNKEGPKKCVSGNQKRPTCSLSGELSSSSDELSSSSGELSSSSSGTK